MIDLLLRLLRTSTDLLFMNKKKKNVHIIYDCFCCIQFLTNSSIIFCFFFLKKCYRIKYSALI